MKTAAKKIIDFALECLKPETKKILKLEVDFNARKICHSNLLKFYPVRNPYIFIPNKTVTEFFNKELNESGLLSKFTVLQIEKILIDNKLLKASKKLIPETLTVFYLLHEEGHYVDLQSMGIRPYQFDVEYLLERKKVDESHRAIYDSRQDDEACMAYAKLYRENPFEKRADKYAISELMNNDDLLKIFHESI